MMTLLVLLCQSAALLSLGLFALRFTRRRGPAVQTLVGRAALSGVTLLLLLAPLTGHVRPVVRVPEPTPAQTPVPPETRRAGGEALFVTPSALPTSPVPAAAGPGVPEGAASSVPIPPPAAVPNPSFRKEPAPEARGSKAVGLLLSLAVSAVLLLWLAICQGHLTRLRRTAQAVTDGPAAALLASLTPNPPPLLTHPSIHSPFLAGLRRPAIFLPPTYAADFDPDALRAIFVHEIAHRDRRDNFWTLAARLLTALLWFQPLLWLLARNLEHISEDACDAAVLAQNCPPRAYANCLLSLADRPPLRRERALSAGVAPFRSSLGRRISYILTSKGVRPMTPLTLRLRLAVAALTVAAALGGSCLVSSAPAKQNNKHSFSAKGSPPTAPTPFAHESKLDTVQVYAPGNMQIYGASSSGRPNLLFATPSNQLDQAQLLAGLTPVQGPGVVVTLQDSRKPFPQKMPAGLAPPNLIHDIDINQTVNELKSAGAEAIAIDGQRLVATSAVRTAGTLIFINNRPATAPYTIKAIGDPKTLLAVLSQTGGIASQTRMFDPAMFSAQQAAMLTLPAYAGGSGPRYARPITEKANGSRQERLNTLLEQQAALQAKYDREGQAFFQYERTFDAALRQALPQGSAQSFARARNLEFGIGWDAADLEALKLKETQHPETRRNPVLTVERRSLTARLAQMRAEEAGLFSKDAEAQRHLAQVHTLALHHPTKTLKLQLIELEIALLGGQIQRLRN